MKSLLSLVTGIILYALLAASFITTAIFLQHSPKPSILSSWLSKIVGEHNEWGKSILTNVCLLFMFASTHSLQSTSKWRDMVIKLCGQRNERVLHAVISIASLSILLYCWHPLPFLLYDLNEGHSAMMRLMLRFGEWFGWLLMISAFFAAARYDQFRYIDPDPNTNQCLKILTNPQARPYVQRLVRQPLFVSLIYIAWSQPRLSVDRLLLNLFFTLYICIGSCHQEQQAEASKYGTQYKRYQQQVPMVLPLGKMVLRVEKKVYQQCKGMMNYVHGNTEEKST